MADPNRMALLEHIVNTDPKIKQLVEERIREITAARGIAANAYAKLEGTDLWHAITDTDGGAFGSACEINFAALPLGSFTVRPAHNVATINTCGVCDSEIATRIPAAAPPPDMNPGCAWLANGSEACHRENGGRCFSCRVFFGG